MPINFENLLVNSVHRPGKSQYLFQSQRRAMTRNVQTTIWLHSFHMPVRLYSKSFKLGFNSMRTENFHRYKLDLEKAEEPEIKLSTTTGLQKRPRNSRKNIYFCFIEYARAFDFVDRNKLENSERDRKNRIPYLSLQKPVWRLRSNN